MSDVRFAVASKYITCESVPAVSGRKQSGSRRARKPDSAGSIHSGRSSSERMWYGA
jgi:hypothetical protein